MSPILQMTKRLSPRPEPNPTSGSFMMRNYLSDKDIDIWLATRNGAFASLSERPWREADFRREFISRSNWNPAWMWFCEFKQNEMGERETVGTVQLRFSGSKEKRRPVINWLAVLPEFRRRGIGRRLVEAAEGACYEAGFQKVFLETSSSWEAAVQLYRFLGYQSSQ